MKVVVTGTRYSEYCTRGKQLLLDNGIEIVENEKTRPLTQQEVWELAKDADAVIAGVDQWNEASFVNCPNVKTVVRFGVGYDNFDLKAGTEAGVRFYNAKGGNSVAVAEAAIGLMMALYRKICVFNHSIRDGIWNRESGYLGHDMRGKKIGLVGFGDIAQKVARLLSGFGVEIYAYDKYPQKDIAKQLGVSLLSFDEIIEKCDAISIHLPSCAETKYLFNREIFKKMKRSAVLINTARGLIVSENDLVEALHNQIIAGAGIDVFEEEPTNKDNPLFSLDNVVVTPHVAAETVETYEAMGILTAETILQIMRGENPPNLLNPK